MARLGRYRRAEVLVGFFSLAGILILVFGMLWLREFRFTRRYSVYESTFPNTGGLLAGDPIMVSGLRKGKVRSMELLDNGIRVQIAIEQDVRLHSDANATIVTRGLLGERYVEIGARVRRRRRPDPSCRRTQIGVSSSWRSTGELGVGACRTADAEDRPGALLPSMTKSSRAAGGIYRPGARPARDAPRDAAGHRAPGAHPVA
jgi:phospholipid/cholesterol/gamma-HCH transport system substrate-binding protein